jgi:hypothetical protein
MDVPSAREEVAILRARVPDASAEAIGWIAKLLDCIRAIPGVQDKPALREGIDLLNAFTRDGISRVDEAVLSSYLCLIAKRRGDRSYLQQSMARIEMAVNDRNEEIDSWINQEFSESNRLAIAA